LKNLRLVLPLLFPGTNGNSFLRDQGFEGFCIIGEPGAPDRFARLEEFRLVRPGELPKPIRSAFPGHQPLLG
jgi:hypothetical protein